MTFGSTLTQSQASFAARNADEAKRDNKRLEEEIAGLKQQMEEMQKNLNGVKAQRHSLYEALTAVAPTHPLADKETLGKIYDANCK